MTELCFETAIQLAARIRSGEISSAELTDLYIDRIERFDGDVNAVVARRFDAAREEARAADARQAAGEETGPLHGVPMTIKESYDLAGLRTTWGHPLFAENVATEDAESVKAYRRAGAVFLGKTNVPMNLADFQSYNEVYGTTGNPWDLGRTPGGSSGGSAAALAAGLTALESGSDIGGSIRNPAHFCGVYGHKPTWGVVPPQGHRLPPAVAGPDIAVCGPLARSAEDLALAMDVLAGPEPLDRPGWKLSLPRPQKKLSEMRVALWPTDALAPVATEVADRVARVGELLAKLGATVSDEARPAFDPAHSHENYTKLLNAVMGAAMPDEAWEGIRKHVESLDPDDRSQAAVSARGVVLSHRDWIRADNVREYIRYAWRDFFDEWDVLVCPQMATPAFPHDHDPDMTGRTVEVDGEPRPYFEQLFWAGLAIGAYLPSTVFPTGPSAAGLPIGLQAVGAEYDDLRTIEFARLLGEEIGGFVPPPFPLRR